MKNRVPLILALACLTASQSLFAQARDSKQEEKIWKLSGNLGLNSAATGLWNWTAGGNSNVNGTVFTDMRLLYHKDKMAWDSNLVMKYGLNWKDQAYDKLQKSDDKLSFSTKFGWEFDKSLYLTVLGSMNTQFAYGRKYNGKLMPDTVISKFMAPGYFDLSLGLDWKPNDTFSLYVSPLAGRITVVSCSKRTEERYFNELVEQTVDNIEALADEIGYRGDIHDEEAAREWARLIWEDERSLGQNLRQTYGLVKYTMDDPEIGLLEKTNPTCRAEFGLSIKASADYKIKQLKLGSTLALFTPYAWDKRKLYRLDAGSDGAYFADPSEELIELADMTYLGFLDNNRRFGNFDVDWTVNLSYQFLKCLQLTVLTDLRYYNGVKIPKICTDTSCPKASEGSHSHSVERVQFKGMLGFGVGYAF